MANLRSLLLVTLALGVTSSLFACTGSKSSENLPPTRSAAPAQSNIKVRHSTVRLDFREQKPRTEARLATELQVQQELLKKQTELKKSGNQAMISTHEVALKQNDAAIASLFEKPVLTEKNLTEAYADPIANSNTSSVGLKFDANGTKTFTTLTKKLAGTGRALGVFLNDRLISSPTIASEFAQTGITGGSAVITRNFSAQEANNLAAQLRGDSPAILPK
jgi:preprotein translocase subunit SecD